MAKNLSLTIRMKRYSAEFKRLGFGKLYNQVKKQTGHKNYAPAKVFYPLLAKLNRKLKRKFGLKRSDFDD